MFTVKLKEMLLTSSLKNTGKSVKKIKMTPLRKKPDMSSYLMRTF